MDSKLHPRDLNPRWRSKWNWRPHIWIPKVWIRISHEKQVKKLKLDLNHLKSDSNPWVWSCEEQVRMIQIFELGIRIPNPKIRLKDEGQAEGFESLSYGFDLSLAQYSILQRQFESPTQRFESLFYRSIKYATCNSNNPIFKCNLSHNG